MTKKPMVILAMEEFSKESQTEGHSDEAEFLRDVPAGNPYPHCPICIEGVRNSQQEKTSQGYVCISCKRTVCAHCIEYIPVKMEELTKHGNQQQLHTWVDGVNFNKAICIECKTLTSVKGYLS